MGLPSLKEKLTSELSKEISEESQVVNILSKVRKIIESNKDGRYKKLKFYCNWALHIEIEDTSAIKDYLDNLIAGRDGSSSLEFFKIFHDEFSEFINEYDFPDFIYKKSGQAGKFSRLLSEIYSETPLILKKEKKKLVWKNHPELSAGPSSFGGVLSIDPL